MFYRHGDVTLHSVGSIPKEAVEIQHDGSFTIALGESTGHHHTLYATKEQMKVYKVGNTYFIKTEVEVPLRHQEHKEIMIPVGTWGVGFEEERDPFLDAIRRVQD